MANQTFLENSSNVYQYSGTYEGQGGYGEGAKNFLSFSNFGVLPKAVIVMPQENTTSAARGGFVVLNGVTSMRGGGLMDYTDNSQQLYFEWDEDNSTVYWYSTKNNATQQNISGVTYRYWALF